MDVYNRVFDTIIQSMENIYLKIITNYLMTYLYYHQ